MTLGDHGGAGGGDHPWPAVTVIMPVLNEERHLAAAVAMVLEQDYAGEVEVVIAIGPSRDRTHDVADELAQRDPRITTVDNPTGRTPDALNAAIAASRHEIIVRVDGHAELPPHYIRRAVAELERVGADNVGGIMDAQGTTPLQGAVACAMRSPLGVGNSRFHVGGGAGPADTVYLGVFRRSIIERVGGYDPSFARAQDWELNHRIREAGGLVWFTPDLKVVYRPRSTIKALARQYFLYGRWRRVVSRRHERTLNHRYLAPPAMVTAVTTATILAVAGWRPAWSLPLGYLAAVGLGGAVIARDEPFAVQVRTPLVLAVMHWSWGIGFLSSPTSLGGSTKVPAPGQQGAPPPASRAPGVSR